MFFRSFLKINLRTLILSLAIFSVVVTLGNSFYATYKVQRTLLIDNTLEANRVYAAKLAEMTDVFLNMTQDHLAYSASLLSSHMSDSKMLMNEARRLHQQSDTFNSVVVVNAEGMIIATSPQTLAIKGITIDSPNAQQSLKAKKPLITDPFISPAGNYLISLSHPVFSASGDYLGYIAGTIYLEQDNILAAILGKHYYNDGSYLYVVDRHKTLIYHPKEQRVGQKILNNIAIDEVVAGRENTRTLFNSEGIEMLAGFAPIQRAGWGVIAQRPKEATLAGLDGHIISVFIKSLPVAFFTLAGIWVSAVFISRPLWQLARDTTLIDKKEVQENISNIPSWYFEAAQLKRAIIKAMSLLNDKISQLHNDSHTDPMTSLLNRRGMQQVLDQYQKEQCSFAVITLDIDHFKRVNDSFGHDVGDKVIQALAQLMRNNARQEDALCRSGGEEFMIFLPNTKQSTAFKVAERLRLQVEGFEMPTAGFITISLGLSHWSGEPEAINSVLKQADKALYLAKQQGRNRTITTKK
ncbi:cell signaling regulator [Oceanisphaera marina]|uniref:diguanylate cyclase n=1 Tax=Oceanisphaera marina TaxID=2017550 RepID=A0ABQ1IFQ5_9GAMM|nr:sensor domain-containing diguanylate cyclase [Oceanisphaera marina]GGB39080.1 cell signaling regulator [Oceanisphaera marina]